VGIFLHQASRICLPNPFFFSGLLVGQSWLRIWVWPEKSLAIEMDQVAEVFGDPDYGFPGDLREECLHRPSLGYLIGSPAENDKTLGSLGRWSSTARPASASFL
jgi:hypothetical protein